MWINGVIVFVDGVICWVMSVVFLVFVCGFLFCRLNCFCDEC